MENTLLVITFSAVDGNLQIIHFWKAVIDFNCKFEPLLASARFIAIELYKEYDIIVTSFKFIRIQISSVTVHH